MAWFVALVSVALAIPQVAMAQSPAKPSHRVVACYFHRTVRCPTCQRIGAYIEESLETGMADEMSEGRVEWVMIDFQNPKNERYTRGYRITGPTLVITDIRDGKVVAWKAAPKVWSLVGKKDAFFKYVQDEVRAYLDPRESSAERDH
jgi:hypothetical protein